MWPDKLFTFETQSAPPLFPKRGWLTTGLSEFMKLWRGCSRFLQKTRDGCIDAPSTCANPLVWASRHKSVNTGLSPPNIEQNMVDLIFKNSVISRWFLGGAATGSSSKLRLHTTNLQLMYFLHGKHNLHLDYPQRWKTGSNTISVLEQAHVRNES